jgi:hypothetical protein
MECQVALGINHANKKQETIDANIPFIEDLIFLKFHYSIRDWMATIMT